MRRYEYAPFASATGWLACEVECTKPARVDFIYASWAFVEVVDGHADVELEGSTAALDAGAIVLLPPLEVVAALPEGRAVFDVLVAPKGVIDGAITELAGKNDVGAFANVDPVLVDEARRAYRSRWSWDELDDAENTRTLISRAAAAVKVSANPPYWHGSLMVRRTKEVIDQNYAGNLSLSELAQSARVSKYHLLRQFRKRVGLAPHAYQVAVRVARAREFLANGFSPADVSERVGFYDQSAFTRVFKRTVGLTPGAYAAIARRRASGRLRAAPYAHAMHEEADPKQGGQRG